MAGIIGERRNNYDFRKLAELTFSCYLLHASVRAVMKSLFEKCWGTGIRILICATGVTRVYLQVLSFI